MSTQELDLAPIYNSLLDESRWSLKGPSTQHLRLEHVLQGVYMNVTISDTGVDGEPSQMLRALVSAVEKKYQTGFADRMSALLLEIASTCAASWALKELDS